MANSVSVTSDHVVRARIWTRRYGPRGNPLRIGYEVHVARGAARDVDAGDAPLQLGVRRVLCRGEDDDGRSELTADETFSCSLSDWDGVIGALTVALTASKENGLLDGPLPCWVKDSQRAHEIIDHTIPDAIYKQWRDAEDDEALNPNKGTISDPA